MKEEVNRLEAKTKAQDLEARIISHQIEATNHETQSHILRDYEQAISTLPASVRQSLPVLDPNPEQAKAFPVSRIRL